jgi:hypothetical protein
MKIGHEDRSMKVAWDVETYLAVDRFSMKHKRCAIGLTMLEMLMFKERREQRKNERLTILALIPP